MDYQTEQVEINDLSECKYPLKKLFEDILLSCKQEIINNHSLLLKHNDINNLHHLRVSLRKLKSILKFFKKEITNDTFNEINTHIKKLIEPTAKTRDFDVFKDEYIYPVYLFNQNLNEFKILLKHAEKKQKVLHKYTLEEVSSKKYKNLISNLGVVIEKQNKSYLYNNDNISSETELKNLINNRINKRYKKIVNSKAFISEVSQNELHKLRIHAKELRYVLSVLEARTANESNKIKSLKKLQDILGKIHDSYVAEQIIHELSTCKSYNVTKPYIQTLAHKNRVQNLDKLYSLKM